MEIRYRNYSLFVTLVFLMIGVNLPSFAQGPGNVTSNLNVWLKANAGTGSIGTSWQDQSAALNHYTTVAGPTIQSNVLNFNPAVEILSGGFNAPAGAALASDWSIFFVSQKLASDNNGRLFDGSTANYLWGYHDTHERSIYLNGNPNNYNSGIAVNNGALTLSLHSYVRTNATAQVEARNNGQTLTTFAGSNSAAGILIDINQGAFGGSQSSDSRIGEFIVFNTPLTVNETERVESYLAIKYGLTISHNYLASNSTIVWDATANATYHNNVTGIGRDDQSVLDQRKSLSINSQARVMMDKAGAFGSDLDFICWGDDNGSLAPTTGNTHPSYLYKSGRTWKAAVTGTPGAVSVSFVLGGALPNSGVAADYALLIDGTDTDFSSGAIAHTAGASINGDTLTFTGVNLADGDFFTLATDLFFPGPGNVTNALNLWLKADVGTGALGTSWQDQSGYSHDYSTVAGPTVQTGVLNYNDAVEILSGGFNAPVGAYLTSDWSVFFVSQKMASDNNGRLFDGSSSNYLWGYHDTHERSIYINGNPNNYNSGIAVNNGALNLSLHSYVRDNGTGQIEARADGASLNTFAGTNSAAGIGIDINQGAFGGSQTSDSRIGEFVIYNAPLSAGEVERVESYLAIRYGLTLAHDYLMSDGSAAWSVAFDASYQNDIIGIGRDDLGTLLQKQSHSADDTTRVYISTLQASNAANVGAFSVDNSYLILGHDNGVMNATAASLAEKPAGVSSRIEREWLVSNTNFSETFNVDLQLSSSANLANINLADLRLLVDTDGNFTNASVYSAADGLVFTNTAGRISVTGIDNAMIPANTYRYFTLGSVSSNTPLPVELLSFKAEGDYPNVILSWETASETDNDYFTLERSQDAINWEELAKVDGAGNSSHHNAYTFTDRGPLNGQSYYRLSQTDFNGTVHRAGIRAVFLKGNSSLTVYPNPGSDIITIKGTGISVSAISIIDSHGAELTHHIRLINKGDDGLVIDVSGLARGVYIVKLGSEVCKFMKK